jgi:hypothetical protein
LTDEPNWMRRASKIFGRATKTIIFRWARCQRSTCQQQLQQGIRYFDIRLAKFQEKKKEKNESKVSESVRVIHGLFGAEIGALLTDIDKFLDQHKGEVVILDFQHIFDFQKEDHFHLVRLYYISMCIKKQKKILQFKYIFISS